MLRTSVKGNLRRFPSSIARPNPPAMQRLLSRSSPVRDEVPAKTPSTPESSRQTTSQPPIAPKTPDSSSSSATSLPTGDNTSSPRSSGSSASTAKPQRRFLRLRNIVGLLLFSTFAYGGAVWYSFRSDNFHDFFTEYVPGSTAVIHAIQDYRFKQRYPGATNIGKGDRTSDLGRKGPHISAIDSNRPEVVEKKKEEISKIDGATKKADGGQAGKQTGKSEGGPAHQLAPPPSTSDNAKPEVQKGLSVKIDSSSAGLPDARSISSRAANDAKIKYGLKELEKTKPKVPISKEVSESEPQRPMKESRAAETDPLQLKIELLDISPNDASLEKTINALNNLIKSVNSSPTDDNTSGPHYEFLKSSVIELNSRLPEIISSTRADAESQIQAQANYFAKLHEELKAAVLQERNLMANEWMTAFDHERDDLQNRYNERLAEELKKQYEVYDQKLQNELLEQAISLRRRMQREIQAQVEIERTGRLGKLASLEKALGELTELHRDSHSIFSRGFKGKRTAIAVRALKDAALVRGGEFTAELAALKSVSNNDELVRVVISSIDPEAYSKGIISQAELASRFQRLATELRKISLLPEDAGIAGHAASWLFSKIMFRQRGYVRGDTMSSRLARVETLLEGGELEDATREVNSFNGWGRELARDWLKEARKRLEVIQAIDVTTSSISSDLQVLETQCTLDALESV